MRIALVLLFGLVPSLVYLGVAQLCYLAWSHDLETTFGMLGAIGGALLGLLTIPAWSLGAPAFHEFFFEYFGGSTSDIHRQAMMEAQADIWLVTLWLYFATAVLSYSLLLLHTHLTKPVKA
jgi:hypothetical protein